MRLISAALSALILCTSPILCAAPEPAAPPDSSAEAAQRPDGLSSASFSLEFPVAHLPVRFGVVKFVRPSPYEPIVGSTIKALEDMFGAENVIVRTYTLSELREAVRSRSVDVFLSSSGFYVRMQPIGAQALATVASRDYPDPNHNDGSTILVSADSSLRTLRDLKGARLVTSSPTAFTGLQLPLNVIQHAGYDPEKFFASTVFLGDGGRMREAIPKILAGEADVGFLRLCYLEEWLADHPEDRGRIRVVNRLDDPASAEPEACARSTPLYPSWVIASTPATAPQVSRLVARALLQMRPAGAKELFWSVATDYASVDKIFRELKIGPYAYLRDWTLDRFLAEYGEYLLIFVLLILGLAGHSIRVSQLVRIRTQHLGEALEAQKRLQHEARTANARIERMGRIGAVGQLSTIFAHEMRQPLAAISLYLFGLKKLVDGGRFNPEQMKSIIAKLSEQTARADAIVARVRAYAKSETPKHVPVDLCEAAQKAISELVSTGRWHARINFVGPAPVRVLADPLEMELVAINLVRNALEAIEASPAGAVTVTVNEHKGEAELSVLNNGPVVTVETLRILESHGPSEKAQGLGLGLSIVRGILERLGGRLSFTPLAGGGLAAIARIPTLERTLAQKAAAGRQAAGAAAPIESAAHDPAPQPSEEKKS
ncbi:PhnD/SsuA/transferrin family substrate-binding protein [uncultured Sutterella sp.]|uniref:sensor histidine kinase n=1 Tax=uncultured Sutterella sp. TaxID=286133 RepID=UPI0025D6CE39|nr:PhnD/SsuA/transferrin family substrate-binding protein [uncultured Sutterella sp.]